MSLVALCSGKSSPGATFVAVNLAAAMARAGDEVLLLDLDPSGGDVGAYLGLDPRRGLHPLLRMDDRLPQADALMREAEERAGMAVVAGFPEASQTGPATLAYVAKQARESGRAVIADLGRVTGDAAIVAREADLVLLVVRPDLVSVLGAERALRILSGKGVAAEHVRAVVSGVERRRPADVHEVAGAIGIEVIGSIPLRRREARRALVSQSPIAKRALARAFESLASTLRERLTQTGLETREPEVIAG